MVRFLPLFSPCFWDFSPASPRPFLLYFLLLSCIILVSALLPLASSLLFPCTRYTVWQSWARHFFSTSDTDTPTADFRHRFKKSTSDTVGYFEVSELKRDFPTPRLATLLTSYFRHSASTPRSTSDSVGVSERPALLCGIHT